MSNETPSIDVQKDEVLREVVDNLDKTPGKHNGIDLDDNIDTNRDILKKYAKTSASSSDYSMDESIIEHKNIAFYEAIESTANSYEGVTKEMIRYWVFEKEVDEAMVLPKEKKTEGMKIVLEKLGYDSKDLSSIAMWQLVLMKSNNLDENHEVGVIDEATANATKEFIKSAKATEQDSTEAFFTASENNISAEHNEKGKEILKYLQHLGSPTLQELGINKTDFNKKGGKNNKGLEAIVQLQKTLGVEEDGLAGPITIEALNTHLKNMPEKTRNISFSSGEEATSRESVLNTTEKARTEGSGDEPVSILDMDMGDVIEEQSQLDTEAKAVENKVEIREEGKVVERDSKDKKEEVEIPKTEEEVEEYFAVKGKRLKKGATMTVDENGVVVVEGTVIAKTGYSPTKRKHIRGIYDKIIKDTDLIENIPKVKDGARGIEIEKDGEVILEMGEGKEHRLVNNTGFDIDGMKREGDKITLGVKEGGLADKISFSVTNKSVEQPKAGENIFNSLTFKTPRLEDNNSHKYHTKLKDGIITLTAEQKSS